jgi:CHASE3 domain sensor protein
MLLNTRKNTLSLVAIFTLIAITAITSYLALRNFSSNNKRVKHTYEVITEFQELLANLNAAESEARAFMMSANEVHASNYQDRAEKVNILISSIF